MIEDFNTFRREILKLNSPRVHKITNSYGVYDGFKYYRKNRPPLKEFVLKEGEYYQIIRAVDALIGEYLIYGEEFNLPHRMGNLELRKFSVEPRLGENGELIIKAPINMDAVLKLWAEDEEARKKKQLVYVEDEELIYVYYNKSKARFKNKSYYKFSLNRDLKRRLTQNRREGKVDAFESKFNTEL